MSKFKSISPIDSRYRKDGVMRELCSYENQINTKIYSEFQWFLFLCEINGIPPSNSQLNELYSHLFNNLEKFNAFEKITKHDIKAVEYYVKSVAQSSDFYTSKSELEGIKIISYIHFGLTSQDIVSLSSNSLFSNISNELIFNITMLLDSLHKVFCENSVLMIGFTHGQPAVPINSKLIYKNYNSRISSLLTNLTNIQPSVKFGGAVGNSSSMKLIGITNIDELMDKFINGFTSLNLSVNMSLKRSENTTQVDNWVYLVDLLKEYLQLASICIDLCRDLWHYCSIGYLYQSKDDGQIGSSTMVQKTNPIDFENCEGIMEKMESDFSFYIKKFSKSRLQRDLTDSVAIRMVFESFAMFDVAINSLRRGLSKTSLNEEFITKELDNHYEMSAEYLQLFMKNAGLPDAYETIFNRLKDTKLTDKLSYRNFIIKLYSDCVINKIMYDKLINFDLNDYKTF